MIKSLSFLLLLMLSGCSYGKETIKSSIAFDGDLELTFVESIYSKGELERCAGSKVNCFQNGVPAFGVGSLPPKSYLAKLTLTYKDKIYVLDTKNMYNAGAERGREVKGVVEYFYAHCYDQENCVVRGLFSDAGGSYVAEWQVINGASIRTILTSSGDIVQKFISNIRPPVYE